jgi:hypothetical protein
MTALMEKALHHLSALHPHEQDAVAALILEEIESEKQWDELFANSQNQLAQLAAQAIAQHQAGKTQPLDPERDL